MPETTKAPTRRMPTQRHKGSPLNEQDWVQEACGDFWMGFDTDELLSWAKDLGFVHREPVLLGLKNGFQVQIHLFKKPLLSKQKNRVATH